MKFRQLAAAAASASLLLGCDSAGPTGTGRVTFQLATAPSASAAASYAAGADVLTITSVQVVARKIRLERAEGTCQAEDPGADPTAGATGGDERGDGKGRSEGDDGGDHDCPDVRLDPMLLEPPVDGSAVAEFSVDLPEGTYHEVKIQIHKLTPAPADAALLAAHPDFAGISIRVVGTFNGTAFTFTTPITAEVEIELPEPLEVSAETPTAVTLQVDLSTWFKGPDGGLLNPAAPSQQTRSRIEQNIRQSFHGFEDHDCNNRPDD
jgi:hypothetical protein